VGAVLVPRLLEEGYDVRVLDLYIYGEQALDAVRGNERLHEIEGDIRDERLLRQAIAGCDGIIHLACISNDPTVELDPELSRSINFDAFKSLVRLCKESGVQRFIFASSGSVYGVTDNNNVTEEHDLVPVSLYNKYKGMCESFLLEEQDNDFATTIVRPATIYGFSPRQRLDLTVNLLTTQAVNLPRITVFGGKQMRPNIHIVDMVDLYLLLIKAPLAKTSGEIFNAAYDNYSVAETADIVKSVVETEMPDKGAIDIIVTDSTDIRSYHLCSDKVQRQLGFVPRRGIEHGVRDLIQAFRDGMLPNPLDDIRYYNIKTMKVIGLQ